MTQRRGEAGVGEGGGLGKPCKSIENADEGNMDETKAKHGKES